jgi:hypothetical protein
VVQANKASGRRRTPSTCVRLGYEREVNDTAYMRARNGSETREKKGEAGLRLASWAGPLHGASEWRRAAGLLGFGIGRRGKPRELGLRAKSGEEGHFLFLF